jgi:hypothetical protein
LDEVIGQDRAVRSIDGLTIRSFGYNIYAAAVPDRQEIADQDVVERIARERSPA